MVIIITGIIGNLGTGKTLLMTVLGYRLYNRGYNIYANYKLGFDYTLLKTVEILEEIKTKKKNAMLLDEIWISADARQSMSDRNIIISRMIAQSRKKDCEVLYTAQWISQIESRIKTLTNMLFHPKIFLTDNKGIPVVLKVDIYYREIMGDLDFVKTIYMNTYGIEQLYDTSEIIVPSKETRLKKLIDKYNIDKYRGLKKGELYSRIIIDEGLMKTEAKMIVDYIYSYVGG